MTLPLSDSHLIVGPAGSGKTNLLLLRANWLSLNGQKNIAVVTFTSTLRDFITQGGGQYQFSLEKIMTMHKWSTDFLAEHGVKGRFTGTFEEARSSMAEAVKSVIDKKNVNGSFPCLLLDEAQDFLPIEVNNFLTLGQTIFAVADTRQQIYTNNDGFAILDKAIKPSISLKFHYRNGKKVCEFLDILRKDEHATPPMINTSKYDEEQAPSSVSWSSYASFDDQVSALVKTLQAQIVAYPNEMIAVLCPQNPQVVAVEKSLNAAGIAAGTNYTAIAISGAEEAGVFASTIHSAKGLEFRAVHVLGLEGLLKMPHSRSLIFTACSRAKTSLTLYHTGKINGFLEQIHNDLYGVKQKVSPADAFGKKK